MGFEPATSLATQVPYPLKETPSHDLKVYLKCTYYKKLSYMILYKDQVCYEF